MSIHLFGLEEAGRAPRHLVGGKAAVLGELTGLGWPVPAGFVVIAGALDDPDFEQVVAAAAAGHGRGRFAVRSSAAAEDLPEASYAGLYETYLDVEVGGIADAVRACFAAAHTDRVRAYGERHRRAVDPSPMAALVQVMVDALSAGVAFTAHPVTGARDQLVVTAVAGLGEPLVAGEAVGEEWTASGDGPPLRTRAAPQGRVLDEAQAGQVAELARGVATHYGAPQDIEWAIDRNGKVWLLQARPMTALPEPLAFDPPGPGLWMRNFRIGEWLPEAVTPLFASWLLPELERGYLDGMFSSIGVRVPFRWALVHDWYYTATPIPSPGLLLRVVREGGPRAVATIWHALIRVGSAPVAADRAVLSGIHQVYREVELPRYRRLVAEAQEALPSASLAQVVELAGQIARAAGRCLWFLAIVGGSAWKIEAGLARFCRRYLTGLVAPGGGVQALLRGLPATRPGVVHQHDVQSLDWFHPIAGELPPIAVDTAAVVARHRRLSEDREAVTAACRAMLAGRRRADFDALLEVAQRYAVIREDQSASLTLGWPALRACAARLGRELADGGVLAAPDDLHFCTRGELDAALAGQGPPAGAPATRRAAWQRHRRLPAPLTLGDPPRLVGDIIEKAVREARGGVPADAAVTGHPASAGRATGPVRVVTGPDGFASFAEGEVLVARATSPAWTPLFARAVAVVTDGGTLAAHASLVAREYGIPAVVGTGNATRVLLTGQFVTVDGSLGTVAPASASALPQSARRDQPRQGVNWLRAVEQRRPRSHRPG